MVSRASAMLMPMAQRFARDHIGGDTVDDAICVARRLAADGIPSTLGFWPIGTETAREMAYQYFASTEALAASRLDGYLSIKPPAFGFDAGLATEMAARARALAVRLHCDSHGIESVDPSHRMIERMLDHLSPADLGTTLPGRWRRSLADADWAIERGLSVRVVKGQWPDPEDPKQDMRQGCLKVIDRLAGRARRVAVASHDLPLLAEATTRLRAAGTVCEVEAIYGVPMAPVLIWARENGVAFRAYIPYGKGFIPNAIGHLRRNPRLAWRVLKGMATPGGGTGPCRQRAADKEGSA
jgi:proline dehydrogenase